ncbi:collectin-11-like [Styela clava]
MAKLLKLFFVLCICFLQSSFGQERIGLCSQVYQMHQYCMNRQDYSTGTNQVAKRGQIGKAGPRGPPGILNYGVINSTISKQFEVLENGLETKFADNFQALERANSNRDDIEHLQRELMNCTRRISNLEEMFTWIRASNNFFYKLFHEKVTYETARSNCKRMGANLASAGVRDSTIRSQLILLIKSGQSKVWIGLDDLQREGNFIWADGVVSTKANTDWSTNQPDNARKEEDCVEFSFWMGWKLNDAGCRFLKKYLCEKQI